MSPNLLIGCAAGFADDRTDVALPVVKTIVSRGLPGVLVFETLAERTLALAQLQKRSDPDKGYAPLLEDMVRPVLRPAVEHSIPIVSNFGAANPLAAAQRIRELANEEHIGPLRIAVVEGDDLSRRLSLLEGLVDIRLSDDLVSANVYLGAEAIAKALRDGAQIVVAGRVADPSLFVGPAMAHFGWASGDWQRLARATMAGHLLECGAQVTGGYYADPPLKCVPDLHQVGFPIVEIESEGNCIVFKPDSTGGAVTERTVKEQLLYEVHDPAAYLTPDVTADITQAAVAEIDTNQVALRGVMGHARPDTLKATVCYLGGWLGESEISYAGANAESRARLAADIIQKRIGNALNLRFDLIGIQSVFGDDQNLAQSLRFDTPSNDVRLRVAGSHENRDAVEQLLREVTALYTCGPAGGGGVRTSIRQRLHSASCFLPRQLVPASVQFLE